MDEGRAHHAVALSATQVEQEEHEAVDSPETRRARNEGTVRRKTYEDIYIGVFRFTEDGRVKFWCEYHKPNKVKEAFPPEWWSTPS